MKLASLANGTADGQLVVVSRDTQHYVTVPRIATTFLRAMEIWQDIRSDLEAVYHSLNEGGHDDMLSTAGVGFHAPMPRCFQWLDASAFLNHSFLMQRAYEIPLVPELETLPLMYQGASDGFLGHTDDFPVLDLNHGLDFEGEFGVIIGDVPMGSDAAFSREQIRFVVLLNDWSMRAHGALEMRRGFGFLHAKPTTAFAPFAVSPAELGSDWDKDRVALDLEVTLNGTAFGHPNGREMNFSFPELIAHAARTRDLSAGTIIGSGTVSNAAESAGSACISERQAIEVLKHGKVSTKFLSFGDRVEMTARLRDGSQPFGSLSQKVVQRP